MILRKFLSDMAIYGAGDLLTKGIALFTFPIIAASFSPRDFGTLELVFTLTLLIGSLANLGLNNAVQRFYWDKDVGREEQARLVSSGLVVLIASLFFVTVCAFLLVVATKQYDYGAISIIGICGAIMLMSSTQIIQYLLDVMRLHFKPWRFFMVSFFSRVGSLVVGVYGVLFLGFGLDGFITIQAFLMMLMLPLALYLVNTDLTTRVTKKTMRQLLEFGYPFIFSGIALWLFSGMDRWMLAFMTSVEEVGIYSVANRFAMIMMLFSMAFGQAWSPLSIKIRTENPKTYRQSYADIFISLFAVMLIIASTLAFFSNEILFIIMPSDYWDAALPLSILSLGFVMQATQQVTAIGISLEKKTFLFARLTWMTAVMNLILNALLIPKIGALGAAWATAVSYLALTAGYLYFTQRLHKLPISWMKIAILAMLWLIVCVIVSYFHVEGISLSTLITKGLGLFAIVLACGSIIPWGSFQNIR